MTSPSRAPAQAPASRATRVAPASASAAWYRRESWLALLLAAFVPTLAAGAVPTALRPVLLGISDVLAVLGLVVLVVQHRRDGAKRPDWAVTAEGGEDLTR